MKCHNCGTELTYITGKRKIGGIPHCKMCYYDELGEVVEEHPIGSPVFGVIPTPELESECNGE